MTDNVVVLNSLGFRGDGTLLVGGAFISAIYVIDPVTGSTSRFGASFPANVTAAGDFVTLPDGDLLASGRDNTGGAYYLYRMRADGSVFPIGEVPSTFGAAMSRGTVYLIGEAGQIHRVDALPSVATTAPLPITTIVDSGQSFYGATSAQDAGSICDPAALTLRKTWVNAAVNDAVAIQATVDSTVVDTLSSTADTTDETDTDATPITVYGGDVITFSETFAVGDPGQYGGSLTCTGNQTAVTGMTLTVANADTDIVCTYVNARPSVTYSKSASTTGPVAVGDTITYTLTTVVADSQTTSVTTLTDTLGTGLTFGAVTNAGAYTCNSTNPLVCTLPVGTVPGTYTVTYTATVNDQAVVTVDNAVVGTNATCATNCVTSTPVTAPAVSYSKSASTSGPVAVGDTITYTLTTTVVNAVTTSDVVLTDTLGTGLTFGAVTNAGAYTCNSSNPLVCTLPVGTVPGTYTVTYTATVNDQAVATVDNAVVGTGEDAPTCAGTCTTQTPVAAPRVVVSKSSDPGTGAQVQVGQTVRYTLTVEVSASALREALVLIDTPDRGLTLGVLPAGCTFDGTRLTCQLPAGTPAGVHTLIYEAVVNPNAGPVVGNR
ncbi:MAG: isopeptide-forming domain-containing fimbrial protein [Pseudoxanthomonas sp.]|nr:MAG: isopeptide-forming domain-containing fimbrial protein [Pseudoxanthomonas sp.]